MKFAALFFSAFLLQSSVQVSDFIFFDKGVDTSFAYGGTSWCKTGIPWEKQFSFAGTFANTPQVIIAPDLYNVAYPTRQVYIKTETITITTTSFTYKISCGTGDDFPKFEFKWYKLILIYLYAFDEKKITVITSDVITNPIDGSIQTHSHTNSVATQGFVYVNSFRYQNSLNFHLELYQIALYSVKVKIHNSSSNLLEIGYTIVIGASNFIQASSLIDTGLLLTSPFTKYQQSINSAPIDAYLLVQIAGLQSNTGYLRYQFFQSVNTVTQISSITVQTWGSTIDGCFIYYSWLFKSKQLPLVCSKYRISRRYESNNSYFTAFHLVEMNLSYFDLNNQQITVPKAFDVINFVLEFILPVGKKVRATILRCNDCGPINSFSFEKKYTSQQNKITIYTTFYQTQSVEKYLILNISLTSLTIIQQINSAIMTTLVEILIQ